MDRIMVDPFGKGCYAKVLCLGLVGLLTLLPLSILAEAPESRPRVAILPFENLSGRFLAIDALMSPVYDSMKNLFSLPNYDEVDEIVLRMRLRHTGFLTSREASEIGKKLEADAIILGMICVYQGPPDPQIALIMKMIGTGEGTPLLWMNHVMVSGTMRDGWFGRDRITESAALIDKSLRSLVTQIPVGLVHAGGGNDP
ncbi:MAG: hypothetical protein ACMUIL_07200 [bacterium]